MLYISRIKDQPYVKFGYTASSPWRRAATGFWSNVHPVALCNKLSYADLELVGLYGGSLAEETAVKASLPPLAGEFWSLEMLGPLTTLLDFMQPRLLLPERPETQPLVDRPVEKLPCCSGRSWTCFTCEMVFRRYHHLKQHLTTHSGAGKARCKKCSLEVVKRNLKRHESTCKA